MKIDQKIITFLDTQRVGVFAIEMLDGSPHGATVHFAHTTDPFQMIVLTEKDYRKSEPLLNRKESRATFVFWFEEGKNSKTFQLDGIARILNANEKHLIDAYFTKFPEKKKYDEDPVNVFFVFIPAWYRYTDWSVPEGELIITSDE